MRHDYQKSFYFSIFGENVVKTYKCMGVFRFLLEGGSGGERAWTAPHSTPMCNDVVLTD